MANTANPTALMGLGFPPDQASAVGNHISTITAAGTSSTTATTIPSNTGTALINGQSSQTGAIISADMPVGAFMFVKGTGANAPIIYAPLGTSLNANSDNTTGVTLGAATACGIVFRATTTKFYTMPLAP